MIFRHTSPLLCTILFAGSCVAQTVPTFKFLNSPSGPAPVNLCAVDLNNDGISDIVATASSQPTEFDVSIARGDGTFLPPSRFLTSAVTTGPMRCAAGNLDGDGSVDLVFTLTGSTSLIVATGSGNGTFLPLSFPRVTLAPGEVFSSALPVFIADFNHDGKFDLLVGAVTPPDPNNPYTAGPQDVYVLEGDGMGGFTARSIYTLPPNIEIDSIAVGDFNSDNNADVVVSSKPVPNPFVPGGSFEVHVLFGTGNFGFEDHLLVSLDGWTNIPTLGTGDVNGDGRSDIFFVNGSTDQLDVYLGQPDKTFTMQASNTPSLVELQYDSLVPEAFTMGDFNDDGRMDLVAYAFNASPQSSNLLYMLGSDPPGTFTYRVVPLPTYYSQNSQAVAGVFNGDAKPDVALGLNGPTSGTYGPTLFSAINSTSGGVWSNCAYPMETISLCSPVPFQSLPGVVNFNASAGSAGLLRKTELWVDGKKITEQHHVLEDRGWLNFTSSFNPGIHHASVFSAAIDNSLQQLDFAFTVGPDSCGPPASPGVNICQPLANGFAASPVKVQASALITGTLSRMEIWVDGTKKFTEFTSPQFEANVELKAGTHRFTVFAVNTAGTLWMQSIDVTVQ